MADVLITPESSSIEIKSGSNNAFGATIGLNGNRLSFSSSAILFTGSVSFNQLTSSIVLGTQVAEKIVTFTPLTGSLTGGTSWYRIISGSGLGDYGRVRMNTTMDNSISEIEFYYGVRNYDNLTGSGAFVYINRHSTYNNVFNAVRVIESGPNFELYAVDVLIGNYLNNTTPTSITCLYEGQRLGSVLDTPITTSVSNTGSYISKTVYAYNTAGSNYIGPAYSDGAAFAQSQGQVTIGYRGNYYYTTPTALNYSLVVSGSVGIGTTNPLNKLSVVGAASIGSTTYNTSAPANGLIVEGFTGIGITNPVYPIQIRRSGGAGSLGVTIDNVLGATTRDAIFNIVPDTISDAGGYLFKTYLGAQVSAVSFTPSGSVGIGTTNPTDVLDFGNVTSGKSVIFTYSSYGEAKNSLASIIGNNVKASPTTNSQVRRFASTNDSGSFIKIVYNKGITFHTNITSSLNTDISEDTNERMRIDLTGNVGIGTTSPNAKLDVAGAISLTSHLRSAWSNNAWNVAQFPNNSTSSPTYYMGFESDAVNRILYINNKNNDGSATDPTGSIVFRTGGTPSDRMIISYGGNVGIGTTSPATRLDVVSTNGSFPATSGTTQNTGSIVRLRNGNSNLVLDIGGHGGNGNWIQSTNRSDLSLNYSLLLNPNGGNVGIGTTDPSAKLEVSGSAIITNPNPGTSGSVLLVQDNGTATSVKDGTTLRVVNDGSAANYSVFEASSGVSNFVILNNGNTGVGTISPSTRLHVSGSSYFQGFARVNLTQNNTIGTSGGTGNLQVASINIHPDSTTETMYIRQLSSGIYQLQTAVDTANSGSLNLQPYGGNIGVGVTVPTGSFHIDNSVINIPVLNLGGGVAGNDISDLYVLNTANTQSGAGFAAKVIGVNISASLDGTNRPVQRTVWGGVTSATALILSPDDPNAGPDHGAFSVWTTSDANSGSILTPKFILRSAGNIGIGSTNPINKLDVAGNISASTITASLFFGTSSWAQTASALPVGTYGITSSWATNAVNVTGTITNALTASNFAGYPIVRFSPALDINQSADANTYYYLIGSIGDNNGSLYVKGLIGGHDLDGGQGAAYIDLAIHSRYLQKPVVGTIYGNVGAQDLMVFASQSAVGPTSGNLFIYLKSTIYGLSELQYMGTAGSTVYYNPSVSTAYPGGNLIFSASAYDTQVGGFSIVTSNQLNNTSSYSAALTSLRNGNIGIGTTNSNCALMIVTSSATSANHVLEINSGFQKQVRFFTNNSNGSYNPIVTSGDSGIIFLSGSADISQNFFIAPWNNTIAGLYISGSGRIGIGTNVPLDALHVSGGIVAGNDNSVAGSLILSGYYDAGALTTLGSEQSSGGPVLAYGVYPSSSVGTFRSSTSITIVRSAYTQNGGNHRWFLGPTQTVAIGASASLSEVMRLTTTGLGIGVTSPVNKLDVAGNISASVITASLFFGTSSWAQTSSWATNAVTVNTASWATNATTAHALNSGLNYTVTNLNANIITASLLRPLSMIELYGLNDVAKGITPTITAGSFNQGGPTYRGYLSYWSVASSSVVAPFPTMSLDLAVAAGANQLSYVTFGTYFKSDTRFIPYSYRIDTSTDNVSWTNQVAVTTNTSVTPLHALSGEFRYIRLVLLSGQTSASIANGYACQVSAFRVFTERGSYTSDGIWGQRMDGGAVYSAFSNNIGIGTTNPQNTLSIVGTLNVGSTTFNTAAPTNGLLIEGSTGIGVTNPATKLHVQATGGSAAAFLSGSDPAAAVSNAYIYAPVGTGFSSLPVYRFWYQNAGISNPASETVAISTNNTERVRVTSDGRVGIGTTTANTNTVAIVSGSNTSIAVINGPSARSGSFGIDINGVYIQNSTNGDYFDLKNASGTARFRIVYDTHTLINTTYTNIGSINNALSGSKLSVFGNLSVGSTYGSNVAGPSNGLIVEGNVGIGITNPANKLDVLGNISSSVISSSRYFSAVPTSYVSNFVVTGSTSAPGFTFDLGTISQSHQARGFFQINDYYNSFTNGQTLQLKSFSNGVHYGGWMLMGNWDGKIRIGISSSGAYNANELPSTYMEVSTTSVNLVGLTLSGTASWATNATNAVTVNTASWATNATTAHALNSGLNYTVTSLTATSNLSASATGSFGRVGIGTNNPVGSFDVRPDTGWPRAEAVVIDTDGGNNPRIKLYRPDGGSATSSYATHLVGTGGGLNILSTGGSTFALGAETITSSLMFISSSGNIGIGTTNPNNFINTDGTYFRPNSGSFLTLYSRTAESVINLISSGSADGAAVGGVYFTRARGQSDAHYQIAAIRAVQSGTSINLAGGALQFFTKPDSSGTALSTPQMVISNDAKVGIGTVVPANPLTVIGAASIGSTTYNTTGPTNGLLVQGNVGIGTVTTPLKLNVSGSIYMASGNDTAITWASDLSSQYLKYTSSLDGMVLSSWNNTVFLTQTLERMRISSTGNVSIGTTVTSARLTVASAFQTTKAIIQSVSTASGLGAYLAFNPGGDSTYSKVALGVYDSYYGSFNRGNLAFMLNSAADGTEVGFADTKMYISASGNVGIGTTTPFSKLDIVTNLSSSTVLQAQGTNGILFSVVDDLSDSLMSVNDASGLPIFEVFADDRIVAGQYNQNDFVIRNNKVGIGTNNPLGKLHITGSASEPLLILEDKTTNGDVDIRFVPSTTSNTFTLGIDDSDSDKFKLSYSSSLGSNDRFVVTTGGDIGIGTSPSYKLDCYSTNGVADVARFYNNQTACNFSVGSTNNTAYSNYVLYTSTGNAQFFKNRSSTDWGGADSLNIYTSNGPIAFHPNNTSNSMFLSTASNLGIGTSNPVQKLDVRGYVVSDVNGNGVESGYYLGSSAHGLRRAVGTNDVYLYTTSGTLYLGATGSSSQQLTLLNGGNVGVGITTPVNKLQVAGNISSSALTASAISSSNINISQNLGVGSSVTIGSTLLVSGASTFNGKVGVGSASPVALFDVVTGSLNPAAKFVGLVGVGGAPATTNIGQLYILGPGSGSTTFPFKFDAVAMDTTANSTGKALKGWLKAYITNVSGFVDGTTYYIPVYV